MSLHARLRFPALPAATLRWVAASGVMLSLALAASVWRVGLDRQAQGLGASAAALRQQLNAALVDSGGASAVRPDFAQGLPEAFAVEPVVRELQRSSAAEGASFVSVSSAPRPATPLTLGRVELAITLRGAYPKLKTVLAQTLDRFPHLVVQRLTLRRMAAPADLEAHVDLVLLARPLAVASGAGS